MRGCKEFQVGRVFRTMILSAVVSTAFMFNVLMFPRVSLASGDDCCGDTSCPPCSCTGCAACAGIPKRCT